jgi:tetratricopeptide (TPR) repeat protein
VIGVGALAVAAAAGFGVWRATRPSSNELLEQGLAAVESKPYEAERMLRAAAGDQSNVNASLALAWLLARRGDWKEAAPLFDHVDKSACRSDLLVKFGQEALRDDKPAEAAEALEVVSRRDDKASVVALTGLVAAYGKIGRQDAMIDAAARLARRQPENSANWWQLIQLHKAAREESECLAAVREALKHNPPRDLEIEMKYMLVDQLMIYGQSAEAAAAIADIEKSEGDSLRLATKKIDLYRLEGRLDKALAAIEAVFPAVGHLPVARLTRGAIYLDLGSFDKAKTDLEAAVAAEPFNEGAHFKLSQALRLLGDEEQANKHVEINLDIRRKRIRINELLKERENKSGDPTIARELAELYAALGDAASAQLWRSRTAENSR